VRTIADREMMRAVVWTAYGPPEVLEVREVPRPVPKDDEVLIRVHATSVFAGDAELRRMGVALIFRFFLRLVMGLTRPKRLTILGQELAGEVVQVGRDVTRFDVGDQVFASTGFTMGGYAEYRCLREDANVARKPSNMTFEEAATIPVGGYNALHFIRLADIKEGERVLINGAGGSIGTVAIQLAKAQGAHVTAVDSVRKLELFTSLGADRVIDYSKQDFTTTGDTYDVIFDVVGKAPFRRSLGMLSPGGRYLMANNGVIVPKFQGLWVAMTGNKRVISKLANERREDLDHLRDLIEEGKVRAAVDRTCPMDRIVEAHRYVDRGLKRGTLAITVYGGGNQ
jgi:NADPH:quinone reductase-like Zn-dependent oxidoreductase